MQFCCSSNIEPTRKAWSLPESYYLLLQTPKYGLIYHASLIGQAPPKFKGKISRVLAAKCALSIRVDALGDTEDASVGLESRAKVCPLWPSSDTPRSAPGGRIAFYQKSCVGQSWETHQTLTACNRLEEEGHKNAFGRNPRPQFLGCAALKQGKIIWC